MPRYEDRRRPPARPDPRPFARNPLVSPIGPPPRRRPPSRQDVAVERVLQHAARTGTALTPAQSSRAVSKYGFLAANMIEVGLRRVEKERSTRNVTAAAASRGHAGAAQILQQRSPPPKISGIQVLRGIDNISSFGLGGTVFPLIDMIRHGRNSMSLEKSANVKDAMPLVAGFSLGGFGGGAKRIGRRTDKPVPLDQTVADIGQAKGPPIPRRNVDVTATDLATAHLRLQKVQKTVDSLVAGIAKDMKAAMGGKFDAAETMRRTKAKQESMGKKGRRAQSQAKLKEQRTQKQELHDDAWRKLEEMSHRPDEVGKRLSAILDEHAHLQDIVHGQPDPFGPIGEPHTDPVPGAAEPVVTGSTPPKLEQPLTKYVRQHPPKTLFPKPAPTGRHPPVDMPPDVAATANKLISALSFGGAKSLRVEEQNLMSAERSRRAAAAGAAMEKTPGIEGFHAGKHELRGELPRLKFDALKGKLSNEEMQGMFTYISEHKNLRVYEKMHTHAALAKVLEGRVPTRMEREMLYRVFGPEFTKALEGARGKLAHFKHLGLEIVNIPRALMASLDMSAPFRQGLVAGARHPDLFAKNFGPMVKSFGSERVYQETLAQIHSDPLYPLALESKLDFTELGALEHREESFQSNLAETLTGGKYSFVRASGRAYTLFLDKMRMDMFRYHIEAAKKLGHDIADPEVTKSIARFINSATGRGDLGRFQDSALHLNALLFSPRLLSSRLNFLDPRILVGKGFYGNLHPYARREALKSMRNLVGFVGSVLFLAKMGGADVELDPRSSNWAKIKIGNTRIDMLGGFQPIVRVVAQVSTGKVISSTTGVMSSLDDPGFGKQTRMDVLGRFARGKEAPTASIVHDLLKGSDFQGQPLTWKKQFYGHLVPLIAQDAVTLYQDNHSLPMTVGGAGLAAFGFGVQTYGAKKANVKGIEKAAKDWTTEVTKLNQGQPIPESLRRARRTQMLYEKAAVAYKLKAFGTSTGHPLGIREEAALLLTLDASQRPAIWTPEMLSQAKQLIRSGPPAAVRTYIHISRKEQWEKLLDPLNARLGAARRAKENSDYAATHSG